MKKTFGMRKVLTLSLASMMMLGGFQAAPFGGVKVVKAQSQGDELDGIKTDLEKFISDSSYFIESPGENDELDGKLRIAVNNSSKYKSKLEYLWLTKEEDISISGSGSSDVEQERRNHFQVKQGKGETKSLWSSDISEGFIRIPFADVSKNFLYLKYEGIEDIYARGFEIEDIPKASENYDIIYTVSGATITGKQDNTLEIQKDGSNTWKTVPSDGFTDLLKDNTAGQSATWKVRTKSTGEKLPSLPVPFTVTKKEVLVLDNLRGLTFEIQKSDKLVVKGFASVLANKTGEGIKYKINSKSEEVIPMDRREDLTLTVAKGDEIKFYLDNESNNYTIIIDKEEIPDRTVLKKDEKTIDFGEYYNTLSYKKEGENQYQTPATREVTNLSAGKYEVRKINTEPKRHQFTASASQGASHTLTFDSEPLTIKLEAPSLPPIIYFPPVVDSSASEEKKTEEKKEEEKKETEKKTEDKASEDKKENDKKAETSIEKDETKDKTPVEPIGSVEKSLKNDKKQNITAKASFVEEVLKAEKGNLNLAVKGVSVKLSEKVLSSVFGGEANEVSLALKTSKVKTAPKALKNRTMISKTSYDVKLMVGKEDISDYDLQGAKFQVKLSVTLKKAPKKLYVLNVDTNRLIKASYKNGKISFKTDEAGKFVIVK